MTPPPRREPPRLTRAERAEADQPRNRVRRRPEELAQPSISTADGAKRRPADGMLVYLTIAAVMLGLVAVYTASFPNNNKSTADIIAQALYAIIGIVFMCIIGITHPDTIRRWSFPLFAIMLGGTLLTLTSAPIVHASHGAALWLKFGPIRFQPSEFAKLALILYVASKLAIGPLTYKNFKPVGLKITIATLALTGALVLQKDQGMATLIVLLVLTMAFLGQLRGRYLAALVAFCIIVGTAVTLTEPYRIKRFTAFVDPIGNRLNGGWHILTMETAIAHGGLLGVGLARCPEKWGQMPEAHTDAVFCVLAGELGIFGSLFVLILLLALIMACVRIAIQAEDNVGYFMASGIAAMFALQSLINLGAATHLMPITGLTLPFMSDGGSSLFTCLAAIGVVISISRHPFKRATGVQK